MGVAGRGRLGSHGSRFLWVGFGLTRIPQISQVLLLGVGNLTEVGGHFRLTRISLLWVFLGLTPIQPIQQEYSHGFRKKMIREIRGIRGFQSATNYHKLSRIIFPCSDSCALSMEVWHKMCSINYAACFMLHNLWGRLSENLLGY